MSFYLGKDNSDKSILHITKGVTAEANMKGGELVNTVFHSGMSLSSAAIIPVTLATRRPYHAFYGYQYLGENVNYTFLNGFTFGLGVDEIDCFFDSQNYYAEYPVSSVYIYDIPNEHKADLIKSILNPEHTVLYLDKDYNTISEAGIYRLVSMDNRDLCAYCEFWGNWRLGFMEFHSESVPVLGNIKYIIVLKPNYYPKLEGSCKVDATGIYINDTDVFKEKTVVTNSPNADIKIFDNLGIVTTTTTNMSGLSLTSENSITTIKKGNKTIFDGNYSYFRNINPKSSLGTFNVNGSFDTNVFICDLPGDYVKLEGNWMTYGNSLNGMKNPLGFFSCESTGRVLMAITGVYSNGLTLGFTFYYLQVIANKLYMYCKNSGQRGTIYTHSVTVTIY